MKFKKNEYVLYIKNDTIYNAKIIDVHNDNGYYYYTILIDETNNEHEFFPIKEKQTTENRLLSEDDWRNLFLTDKIKYNTWYKHITHLFSD